MNITFVNTGEVVNLNSSGPAAKFEYPIGAGLSQKIRVTDPGSLTHLRVTYIQDGNELKVINIPTRPVMLLDLSIFSSLTQSLPEAARLLSGTLQRSDAIQFDGVSGGTSYGYCKVGVTNIGSSMLGGFPGLYNNGNMWKDSNELSISSPDPTTTLSRSRTYGMGFPEACRVEATGNGIYPVFHIFPTNYAGLPPTLNAFSFGLFFKNDSGVRGTNVFLNVNLNGQLYDRKEVAPGEGGLFKWENVRVGGNSNSVSFSVVAKVGRTMTVFYSRLQLNEGSTLRNWSPHISEVSSDDNSKRYGFLTDYADGWKVTCEDYMQNFSQNTGYPFQDRIYWGSAQPNTPTTHLFKYLKVNNDAIQKIEQGFRINYGNPKVLDNYSFNIINRSGPNTYGTLRYRRIPNLPPPNRRVCMNWLNSYGTYDTLYSTEYNVVPTLTMQGTDGNKVQHYDVRIVVPVTENNERALEVLMRSQHVRCVIPNAPFQWAKAEIVGNALSFYAGGSTVKSMTIRFKAQIIGNW
ncbi:hypothetical protein PM21P1_00033 [Parabacteroides phage PM21P1]|nr:hypothetical protein PM21P1_00033 [Parabacteroides phage PM21P1]